MRPQLFACLGESRYVEIDRAAAGDYFGRSYLGRGMARLDWNRDGREDVAVSHIGDPAALVTGMTPHPGHYLALRLCGRDGARDAYGAVVTVTVGKQRRTRQLVAGSGFHACNERLLVFGLGEAERADRVDIIWPSGTRQSFENVGAGGTWIALERVSRLFRFPGTGR